MIFFNYIKLNKTLKILIQVAVDAICVFLAYYSSLLLRFGAEIPSDIWKIFIITLAPMILIYCVILNAFSLYRSFWETASIDELIKVGFATAIATIASYLIMLIFGSTLPKSIYIAGGLLFILLAGNSRMAYRIMRRMTRIFSSEKLERAMIIGAGETGELVVRQLLESNNLGMKPVVIVDDNKNMFNTYLRGIKIAGNRQDIASLTKKYKVDVIVFCLPSAKGSERREILNICTETHCMLKTVPSLDEIINHGQAMQLRKIEMSDLLTRPETEISAPGIREYITGSCVLVTGGGGSIGSELCRQIALFIPAKLVVFDIYENNAYELQLEMHRRFPGLVIVIEIGSVRDTRRLEEVFHKHKPDVVFHAAAHKHVPLMEDSPSEAVKNNIFGTLNTARAADQFGVKRFVLISTDKAVHPSSVMGATKRLAEHVIQYMNSFSATKFVAVRFGNVLGSHGSVIPLFKKQIEHGGPVTVTHKDITRYFMTIPEASRLVLQAGSMANSGEIFILDMGEPIRIEDVARMLIRLSGYQPDVDIKIEYTGLRPGEKLYEELFLDEERTEQTTAGGILIGLAQHPTPEETLTNLKWLWEQIESGADIKACLQKILVTYRPIPIEQQVDEEDL